MLLDEKEKTQKLLLTRKEVAELLNCSDRHVARLEKDGLIPKPVRLRSRVLFSREKIQRWVEEDCPSLAV